MANSNNFISLYGCVDANGYPIPYNNPLLQDVSAANLMTVTLESVVNWEGNSVPCFKLVFASARTLSYQYFYLPVTSDLPTLTQFLADLQALSSANTFSLYTNLEQINGGNQSTTTNGIIVNDAYAYRIYNPGPDTTDVYVNISNDLSTNVYTVAGDQTEGGTYTYFGA